MNEQKEKKSPWKIVIIILASMIALLLLCITAVVIAFIVYKPFDATLIEVPSTIADIGDISWPADESSYDHPLLSEDQEILLESAGVDTSNLPTEVTAEQIDCGVEALGEDRINEIKAGAEPTISDVIKAAHCL